MIKQILVPHLKKLPLTKLKLLAATVLYKTVKLFIHKDKITITRKGIRYCLDLREGIDLSLFLFSNFQKHITSNKYITLPEKPVILDIGANIGSMALSFSSLWEKSIVHAIEPSDYSYEKLLENIRLNPDLDQRIHPHKLFFSDQNHPVSQEKVYSSWKIDKKHKNRHPVHGGLETPVTKVRTLTLDDFCESLGLGQIDLIKIDTDGHEYSILTGSLNTLKTRKPLVIFETGAYIMRERSLLFQDYYSFFTKLNYRLFSLQDKVEIGLENYATIIPVLSTIDILAIPEGKN